MRAQTGMSQHRSRRASPPRKRPSRRSISATDRSTRATALKRSPAPRIDSPLQDLLPVATRIGAEIAGPASADVDRQARFPHEAFAALREERLLSALVPTELGGAGATLIDVAGVVEA